MCTVLPRQGACLDIPGPLSLPVLLTAPIVHKYFCSISIFNTSATIGPMFQISQSGMKGEHLDKRPAMSRSHLAALFYRSETFGGILSKSAPQIWLLRRFRGRPLITHLLASNACTGLLGRFSRVSWVFRVLCHVFGPWYGSIGNVVRVAGHGRGLPHSLPWLAVHVVVFALRGAAPCSEQ